MGLPWPCPECHQNEVIFDGKSSKLKCLNCGWEIQADGFTSDMLRPCDDFFPEIRTIHRIEPPDWMRTMDGLSPRQFPSIPGLQRISYEPDEQERKGLYWGSFITSSVIIIGFLGLTFFLEIPWQTLGFGFLFWALLVSRGADILTTFFGLAIGGTETNPLSDSHDISKLVGLQGLQIFLLLLTGYFLGSLSPWLGNGFLLWFTIMGFRAALSNVTQLFSIFLLPSSPSEAKTIFYLNAVICSFIICGLAYFILPYFLP